MLLKSLCLTTGSMAPLLNMLLSIVACTITAALADDTVRKNATTTCKEIDNKISTASDVIYPGKFEERSLQRHTLASE